MTEIARTLDELRPGRSVVTIGVFDGVHRGHQTIIGRAVRAARDRRLRSVAVTFDRHPAEVVRPGSQPPYLQPLERRIASLSDQDLDLVLVMPFTVEFSRLDPAAFVERVLAGPLQAAKVVVGSNFRFGHRAAGDVVALTEYGAQHGFEAEAVTLLHLGDTPISSTEIREALERGDVDWAKLALGRPFTLEGAVVRGDGRGRSIGIPTANIGVDERLLVPAGGVYAGHAHVPASGRSWPCVVNIGTRPTFDGQTATVEAHLIGADVDLYGAHLAVTFEAWLRPEQRFEGAEALVAQIRRDIAEARGRLGVERA